MKWSRRLALIVAPAAVTVAGLLPGAAAQASSCDSVVITVQPTTTQVSIAMAPAVTVAVEQPGGKVDHSYNGPVSLSYAVNKAGAPVPAGAVVYAVKGVATFSQLTFGAVGFGFELKASISGAASAASAPFDIVGQLVQCSAGKSCQSKTVSSDGTSGSVTAAAAPSSDQLTATGGGFPSLSCTSHGGVVSFSVQDRAKVITVSLNKSQAQQAKEAKGKGASQYGICFGSPVPFVTASGKTAAFNSANSEYEGLLPACSGNGTSPCVKKQTRDCAGNVTTVIAAPAGDPHITY
jgi:hypothetical protein